MSKPTTNTSQKSIPYISPDNGITRYYADRFYLDAPTGLLEYQLAQKEREAQQSHTTNNNNSANSTTNTTENVEYCNKCGSQKTPPNPSINNGRTLFNRSKLINSLDLAAVIVGTYSIGDFDYLSDEFPKLFPRRQNKSATNDSGMDKDGVNEGVNQKVGSRKRKRHRGSANTRPEEKSDHVPTLVLHGQKRFNLNTWTKGRYSVSSWTHSLYSGPAGSDRHLPHHKNTEGDGDMLSMEETIKRMERDSQIKTQSPARKMMEYESQDSMPTDDNDMIRMEHESQDSLPTDADILDDLRFPGCGRRLDEDMDDDDGDDHSVADDDDEEEQPQPHSQPQSNIEDSEDSLQGIRGGGDSQQFVESQDSVMTYQTPPVIDNQPPTAVQAHHGKGEGDKSQQQQQQKEKQQQIDNSPADDSVVNKIWYETPPGCKAELELKDVDTQVKEKRKEINADVVIRPTFTYGNVTIKLPSTPKTHKRRRRRRRQSSSGSSKRGKEDKSEVKQQQQPLPKEDQPLEVATAAGSGPVKETPISSKGSNIKPADMNVDEDETKKPSTGDKMDTDNAADTNIDDTNATEEKKPAPSTDKDKDKADMEVIDLCDSSQSQGTVVNEMPKHASEVKQPPRKRQKTSFNHTVFATTSTKGKAKRQANHPSKKKKKKTSFDRTVFSDITRWDSTAKPVHSFDGQVYFTQILPAWCKPILPKDLSPKKRARAAQSAWKGEADEFNKKEEDSTSKMGCNHPKFFLLFEKSGSLVVIITTSNLTPGTSTEGSWVQRFEPVTSSTDADATPKQGSGVDFGIPSDFGVILSDFLEKQSEAADLANDNYSAKAVCGKNSKGAYVKVTKTMGDGVSLDDTDDDDDGEDDNDWRQPNAKFPGSNADEVEAFFHGEKRTATFTHFAHYEHAKNWRKKYFSRKKYVGNVLPDGFLRRFVPGLEKKGLAGLADQYQFDISQVHLVSTVPGDYLGNLGDRKPCVTYGPQRVASILSRINDDKNGNVAWIPPSLNDRLVIQPTSFGIRWTSTDLETVAQSFLHHPQQNEDTHQEPLEMTDIVWPSLELFDEIERQRRIIWNKPPMEGETLAQRWANKQTENGVSCYHECE